MKQGKGYVNRTFYISRKQDEYLNRRIEDESISKMDLVREVIDGFINQYPKVREEISSKVKSISLTGGASC